ncbi:hypothetical protein B9479_002122 [Cryptococcus floricola]|uniref:Phosphotransferase n=1 Tax=Cryptococcus floricola TaxID=2591691 RepID=A0A5D3B0D9_9TREE|nr:hypothetical protein B9479_002122 [Cryptococcus floricola]
MSTPAFADIAKQVEPYFHLTEDRLRTITKFFIMEMEEGLANYGKDVAMIPAFVTGVPDGTEQGAFLALDLGGTNLRVCLILLQGNNSFKIKQQKYKVSDALKTGEARILFDYIAESVDAFLTDIDSNHDDIDIPANEPMHLGFTFSFPVEQTAIDAGKLLTWTKGFETKNAIGHDVVRLLQDAFDRKHIHVKCSALVNDTVGTLLSRSYQSGPALIGAIFGTGTNGAYIHKTRDISKMGEEKIAESEKGGEHAGEYMVVNTEWGAFDNKRRCLPVSIYDNKLDRQSINPRKQAFEKMISGMYLGEITRNILLHMIDLSLLFGGNSTKILNKHEGFDAAFVSGIEAAKSDEDVKKVIHSILKVPTNTISYEDITIVKWAVKLVADRACQLSAVALAAVIQHTGNDKTVEGEENKKIDIGVDGSVAEFVPRFNERLLETITLLLGKETAERVSIGLAKDGSGVGAALTALQARKAIEKRSDRSTHYLPGSRGPR